MTHKISLGAIGWKNHAEKVIETVNGFWPRAHVVKVYHPRYVPDTPYGSGTSDINDLFNLDGVMILSPNDTHLSYIEMLLSKGFKGYIFCEKPPVTNLDEFHRLHQLDPKRVMYDFSLRHSYLKHQLDSLLPLIGTVIKADAWVTHGFAYKPGYASSWRADSSRHHYGLLESVSIHWIDMLLQLLGSAVGVKHQQRNIAKSAAVPDTSVMEMRHVSGALSTIVASYAAPAFTKLSILGNDGAIELEGRTLSLYHPRDSFDDAGRYVMPQKVVYDVWDPFEDGLRNALVEFIGLIEGGTEVPPAWFKQSLDTMDVIFECKGLII